MRTTLNFQILPQPTETTCGPTCLHGVYRYFNDEASLADIIRDIPHLEDGGTLAVMLGRDALNRGYGAKIYTYNVDMFDPTWFDESRSPAEAQSRKQTNERLSSFIRKQKYAKSHDRKLQVASDAYLEFLALGGEILFRDLTPQLIRGYLEKGTPVLTGLSATYLYRTAREMADTNEFDSISGTPSGHFVVIAGMDREKKSLLVADPFDLNPFVEGNYYWIETHRVISSILLGILTYDANLLVIEPKEKPL